MFQKYPSTRNRSRENLIYSQTLYQLGYRRLAGIIWVKVGFHQMQSGWRDSLSAWPIHVNLTERTFFSKENIKKGSKGSRTGPLEWDLGSPWRTVWWRHGKFVTTILPTTHITSNFTSILDSTHFWTCDAGSAACLIKRIDFLTSNKCIPAASSLSGDQIGEQTCTVFVKKYCSKTEKSIRNLSFLFAHSKIIEGIL